MPILRSAKLFFAVFGMFFVFQNAIGQNQSSWSLDQVESVTGNGNPTIVPVLTPSQNNEEPLLFLYTQVGGWECFGQLCYGGSGIPHFDYLTSLSAPWQTELGGDQTDMPGYVWPASSNIFYNNNYWEYDYWDSNSTPVGANATVVYDPTIIGNNWGAILALIKYQGSAVINRPIVTGTFDGSVNGTTAMGSLQSNPGFLTFNSNNPGFLIGFINLPVSPVGSGPQSITDPAGDSCEVITHMTSLTGCFNPAGIDFSSPPPYCIGDGANWQLFICPKYTDQTSSLTITPTDQSYDVSVLAFGGQPTLSAKITDTTDIMNGNITVKLTAPAGTDGNLNLDFNGSDSSSQLLSQATFPASTPNSQNLLLPSFDTILPGIYPTANGYWDALLPGNSSTQTLTVPDYTLPTPWTYFRKIFYTQYNVPHERSCSGGDEDAWLVTASTAKGKTTCSFTKIKLNTQFIKAIWTNGTGIDNDGDILKNAAAVDMGSGKGEECYGQYPPSAIGTTPKLPNGKNGSGNTFEVVSSVTGSCNTLLIADQSLAAPSTILSGVQSLSCGDQLNLDSGDYTTASTRSVADSCPYCSDTSPFADPNSPMNGADGHIDSFSSNTSCTGKSVGSLGIFYTSYPTN